MRHFHVLRIIHILDAQGLLNLWNSCICWSYSLGLFIYSIVHALLQHINSLGHADISLCRLGAWAGNNQRCSGLIHQNTIHLIHNGIVQLPLYHLLHIYYHIISQVVKAKFIISTKGNITAISIFTLWEIHIMTHQTYRQAQEVVKASHLDAVTLGQIIINSNNVYTLASQGIQIGWQSSYQSFTLTSTHFCNLALVETNTTHHLHIKMSHAQNTAGSLSNNSKGLWQNIIQSLTLSQTVTEFVSTTCQRGIAEIFQAFLKAINLIYLGPQSLYFFIIIVAQKAFQNTKHELTPNLFISMVKCRIYTDSTLVYQSIRYKSKN